MTKIRILIAIILLSVITNIILILKLPKKVTPIAIKSKENNNQLFEEINPTGGFEINARFNNLGPMMIASGIIDKDKFINIYEKSNQPLTEDQVKILVFGSDEKIKITRENSYFLLNFFWAVGLNNKSKILDEGDMMKYGGLKGAGDFASTGGWSLASGNTMNYYSKASLITLTLEQEKLVEEVSSNIFRPCCNNSTAFPDCNHGMALLGVLQLMAGNGASEGEMYEAGKYFNAFWFPGNYYDLAMYFKNKENLNFTDIDAKLLLSKDYSSASGSRNIKTWLSQQGLVAEPPKTGGGCGV
ncbi:hypothetical protein A2130_04605 [Candidatus Woesebacteria bacterium GWC2_33_12]|uniref:Uncharacterized protein n=1 Tax=Candidatus Woesebacteria bacterium GW2011_GWB1_33_22 TaxID=1618566 RepID=A0A0G0C1P2_9BACT|nr:MAG: hypothetical protein UR29_C0005G0017 [Candidatus Woesebacteria bacterium GW2011_GWC2_33_12]KKP42324.1 MAG: hypothetical protein UR33_C0003G0017 [Candidatus Woesebacteria bacterium GW2011_GWA2_33_20]KKP45075.1 MAG: hypothetical protein UR35_C0003G0017 [Candidatus Woesebacteria bacterium GW2011_GWB1_33_22]KKP46951.1 MAG: hypothetical protein UR37_C0003G0017 [Microgenomates group bacterium GW2011_GWC1_33_28]KKP50777.1 MAG: hypothetical protein UR41_C0003G0017 [Candidatus Woesebacteria bact